MKKMNCPECGKEIPIKAGGTPAWAAVVMVLAFMVFGYLLLSPLVFTIKDVTEDIMPKLSTSTHLTRSTRIESETHWAPEMFISSPAILEVKVVETFGRNIEFQVLREGKKVYSSGVKKGRAECLITAEPGKYSIVVKNDNLFDAKNVNLTATAYRK